MNIVTVLKDRNMMENVLRDIKDIYGEDTKVCYITLNTPHTSLMESLMEQNIDLNRVFIVDAITKTVIHEPRAFGNCAFVSSPTSFEELFLRVDELLQRENVGAVVFDSVCTMFSYAKEDEAIKFLRRLALRVGVANCEGVFVAIESNIRPDLLNQLNMVADKVVYIDRT